MTFIRKIFFEKNTSNPTENKTQKTALSNIYEMDLKTEIKEIKSNCYTDDDQLDDPTKSLVKAIKDINKESNVELIESNVGLMVHAIVDKAKLNILIPFSFKNAKNEVLPDFVSPLYIAVYNLSYPMISFLLENGANPNLLSSNKRGLLEALLTGIRIEQIDNSYKTRVSMILDILLCYGLNSNIEFTQEFQSVIKDCDDILEKKRKIDHTRQKALYGAPIAASTLVETRLEDKHASALRTKIVSGFFKTKIHLKSWGKFKYIEMRTNNSRINLLKDYTLTMHHIRQAAAMAEIEIKREKIALFIALHCQIDLALNSTFTPDLIMIIAKYTTNYDATLHKTRCENNNIIQPWLHDNSSIELQEDEKKKIEIAIKRKIKLHRTLSDLFDQLPTPNLDKNQLIDLINDYTDEDKVALPLNIRRPWR